MALLVSPAESELPGGQRHHGKWVSVRELAQATVRGGGVPAAFAQLTVPQQQRLAIERIRQKPTYAFMRIGKPSVGREEAIQAIEDSTPLGALVMELEGREVRLTVAALVKQIQEQG